MQCASKIKACPVCGEKLLTVMHNERYHWVVCDSLPGMSPSCGLSGPAEDTEEKAIARWNRLSHSDPTPHAVMVHAFRHKLTGAIEVGTAHRHEVNPAVWDLLDSKEVVFEVD